MDIHSSKLQELKQRRSEGMIAYFSATKIVTKVRLSKGHQADDRESETELFEVSVSSPVDGANTPRHTYKVTSMTLNSFAQGSSLVYG